MATNYQNVSSFRSNPTHKYIDLNVRSFSDSDTVTDRRLRFSDTRDEAVINSCADYEMSVVRFEIDSYQLPVINFQVKKGSSDLNRGAYAVYLEFDDGLGAPYLISSETPLFWTSQSQNTTVPPPPIDNPFQLQLFTDYYYCYSYQYFIELLNTALDVAMTELKGLVPAIAGVEAPFLAWDTDSQSAIIYARESHFDSDVFPKVNIYFNRPLYSFFSTFNYINFPQRYPNLHKIELSRFNGANVTTLPAFGVDQLIFSKQETSTIGNMSPVSSIVFTSSSLPIVPNDLSTPQIYLDGEFLQLGNTYSNNENIITDLSNNEGYRPNLIYTPSVFRFVSLLNNTSPIKNIDISVFWRNYLGQLEPMILPAGASSSIKILFRKLSPAEKLNAHN